MTYGLLAVVLLIWGTLLTFRYLGLPEQIGARLAWELRQRGLAVDFRSLYLDSFFRVVARDVVISQAGLETVNELSFDHLTFEFNWLSWWRDRPFLERAIVRGGKVRFPLNRNTRIELENVEADMRLLPDGLVCEYFEARLLNLRVGARGTLLLHGFKTPEANPSSAEQVEQRARLWEQIEDLARQFDGPDPIRVQLDFEARASELEESAVRISISASEQLFRGIFCRELALELTKRGGRVQINGNLEFLRGGLTLDGIWYTAQPTAEVGFSSDVDLSLLASALPAPLDDFLRDVEFSRLPQNEGTVEFEWARDFSFHLITRSDWRDFSVRGVPFESLYFPFSYDGKRMMISQLVMENITGSARLDYFFDGDEVLKGRVQSTLDPTSLQALFGPKAQPFFDSLKFNGIGPLVDCQIRGTSPDPDEISVSGTVSATDFSYKDVELKRVESTFTFEDQALHLPDLVVVREEGEGRGNVWHDLKNQEVRLKGVTSQLNLQRTARIIGDKMEEYARPYRFFAPPRASADGFLDLDDPERNDLRVRLVSPGGMNYDFLGKTLTLTDLDADLFFEGKQLRVVPRKSVGLFDGKLDGQFSIRLIPSSPYQATVSLKQCNFGELMETFFGNENVTGRIACEADLSGQLNDLGTINGTGQLEVTNGVLYPIPIFGTFSDILNQLVPDLGYSQADKAHSDFVIENGVIDMKKIDVYSDAFALIGNGRYNMVQDSVAMNMRVNMRGLMGVAFFPLSKLFEYRGTGSLNDTQWEPKSF